MVLGDTISLWSLVVGIASLVVAIVFFMANLIINQAQRSRKELTCEVLSEAPVVNITADGKTKSRLQVSFDGSPLDDVNVTLVVYRLVNTGNVDIVPNDFLAPIKLTFGTAAVLTADVLESNPSSLQVVITYDSTQVQLMPALLNSRAWFKFSVLLTKYQGTIKIESLIVGINDLLRKSNLPVAKQSPLEALQRVATIIASIATVVTIVTFLYSYLPAILHLLGK